FGHTVEAVPADVGQVVSEVAQPLRVYVHIGMCMAQQDGTMRQRPLQLSHHVEQFVIRRNHAAPSEMPIPIRWRHTRSQLSQVGSMHLAPSSTMSLRSGVTSTPHNVRNVCPGCGGNPSNACRRPAACCQRSNSLLK